MSFTKLFSTPVALLLILFIVHSPAWANEVEDTFIAAGLVDVTTIDPTIQVDLVNADPQKNFFQKDFYNGLKSAYLQKPIALKLARAQKFLKEKQPTYSLQILDAARPRRVSQQMYDQMKGTRFERFVANPDKGSMRSYGVAVDITIVDGQGKELDMGITPFRRNKAQLYWAYAKKRMGVELSEKQKRNRALLATVMQQAGFIPLSFEWWHFNGMEKAKARKSFQIIE